VGLKGSNAKRGENIFFFFLKTLVIFFPNFGSASKAGDVRGWAGIFAFVTSGCATFGFKAGSMLLSTELLTGT
jgi:hypothetical protein